MKKIIILLILGLGLANLQAKNYYIAPTGNDTTGTGTLALPYRTIMKAQNYVVAGDTVFLRGGTYYMQNSNMSYSSTTGPYAVVNNLSKSGTSTTGYLS